MKYIIDKQTAQDLELFEKVKGEKSIFAMFNFTQSVGGKNQLEYMFSNPMVDIDLLEERIQIIQYFQTCPACFKIDKECLDFIEHYLAQQDAPYAFSVYDSMVKAFGNKINPTNEYFVVQRGVRFLIEVLNDVYEYAKQDEPGTSPLYVHRSKRLIRSKIEQTSLKGVPSLKDRQKFTFYEFGRLDYCFRKSEFNIVKELLEIIYEYDAFNSIALAIRKHGFSLPTYYRDKCNYLQIKGLFHPFLDNPVPNDFEFEPATNVCFLSGPNMAGKSTFLKSLSIAVYLSHLGFPVPASYLKTSLYNGLLTTINLSDNINKGYSHYYSEVLRVKYVAEQISSVGNIFVVFDELFRGTNVKDAYEASLSVISAISKLKKGVFAISSHIIEVAEELKDNECIFFRYFEARFIDGTPQYTYKIKDGITDERIGMYILNKEKVIETIEQSALSK